MIRHGAACNRCRTPLAHNPQHDAYYCSRCDRWLEDTCDRHKSGLFCRWCVDRPLRPSLIAPRPYLSPHQA